MPSCTWQMVRGCLRCLDGVSANRPHDDCRVLGKGATTADQLLSAMPARPTGPIGGGPFAPGLYAAPGGGGGYGAPGGFFPGFGGFAGGVVYVHDAVTDEWVEHDAPGFLPAPPALPVAFTPMPAAPSLEVPVPLPVATPGTGTTVLPPPRPAVPVPEPGDFAIFAIALAALALCRRNRA